MQLIPTTLRASSEVAPQVTVFLTRSVYDWRTGEVITGKENDQTVTEEPMIVVRGSDVWVGEVRPEGGRVRITPDGKKPFYLRAEEVRLYSISGLPGSVAVARYECGLDGRCVNATEMLGNMLGMSLREMEGIGWLRAAGRSVEEKAKTWLTWKNNVEQYRLHTDDYYLINQNTGETQECQTIATVELKRGKPALYRGIVVKV